MRSDQVFDGASSRLAALEDGNAFVLCIGWRAVGVRGTDARRWLHDLVTADVAGLEPGRARRSLVLSPTGRIRADVHVACEDGAFLILQDPDQPEPIQRILAPYVLSSDVELRDRTDELAVFAVLGGFALEDGDGFVYAPSVIGTGVGAATPIGGDADRLAGRLASHGLVEVSGEVIEQWRITHGMPRMGPDFGPGSLPAEAGLEEAIDFTKGCFLGQESVAKVRNLGHPRTTLIAVRSDAPLVPGAVVLADGSPVGEITSATSGDGPADAIARVRWGAAEDALTSGTGRPLLRQTR